MCAVQEIWVMWISYGTCAESHVDGWRWGEDEEKKCGQRQTLLRYLGHPKTSHL